MLKKVLFIAVVAIVAQSVFNKFAPASVKGMLG